MVAMIVLETIAKKRLGSSPSLTTNVVRFHSLIEVMVSRRQGSIPCKSWYCEQSDNSERRVINQTKQKTHL